ncbi:MAG: prolyl oligopeptidase family serine peptidase [Opitutaceae bacterium]|nr:prolyl oligopeptidase family serine peptidase [Opitutaceae bacterium]
MSPCLARFFPFAARTLCGLCVAGFAFLVAATARAAEDPSLAYFRDLAETRNYTLGRPVSPRITPDGKHVIFLRSAPRNPTLKLYEFDLATQRERELLTPAQLLGGAEETLSAEEKARRERLRQSLRGFTAFQMSTDGSRLLVTLSGKLYVVARSDLKVIELPGSGWIDPRFSPDGSFVAAAGADRELHVIELGTNTSRAITRGATGTLSHGTAEFVAQEEMSRNRGYWWSPDSQTLLVQETDDSQVEVRWVADPLHPEQAPTKFFYPRAGTPNAIVRLMIVPRAGGEPRFVQWDNTAFPYLAHVTWQKNAPPCILVQNREQTEQILLAVNAETGATAELLRETDAAWLNLDDNGAGSTASQRPPFWLADGESFLWTTESRGTWQVELRHAEGKLLREITPVDFGLRGLVALDEDSGAVFVRGGTDAREVQLWSFPLSGDATAGRGQPLTSARGQHSAMFTASARLFLRTTDLFDGTWRTEVISADDARVVATLPSLAERIPRLPTTSLTRTFGEPSFDAAVTRPRDFSAGKKYPVILSVYAGPTSKRVMAEARGFLTDQWMADHGYIVVRLDGRGTPWRGRAWERVIKGNFIDIALADQIGGLQALAKQHPELDLTRVGVSGWSFGGYFSAMAAIRRPDVFKAAVVGAPVITWENYDTHYTERYLGLPQKKPESYRVSNVTTYAAEASRPLLLIHGFTDDNVYFQHTLQLADALYRAGKPYELLPMLGTHMISDPLVRMRQQQRIMEFLNRTVRDPR